MSYKLLMQVMDYESIKSRFTSNDRKKIEEQLKQEFTKLKKPNLSQAIVKFIDDINNS